MKALVTGGAGVVGRALVRHLLESGDEVIGIARSNAAAATLAGLGATVVRGDIRDYRSCLVAAAGSEVVFHLAGLNEPCPKDPTMLHEVNVNGTRNIVRAAVAAGTRRVVYTSSVAAHDPRPTAYGTSKRHGERVAFAEATDETDVVAVAPSSVQGPGRVTGTGRLLIAVLDGKIPLLPDVMVSLVDIRDCAVAHRQAAVVGESGSTHLVSGWVLATRDIARLAEAAGLPHPNVWIVPSWLGLAAFPLALLRPVVGGRRLCPDLVRTLARSHLVDGRAAAQTLGFSYRPLEQTISDLAEWTARDAP